MSENIIKIATEIIGNETNFITNAANISALIYDEIKNLNWVGFYMMSHGNLLLGPFMGKPACINIKMGSGVCGTSALERRTIIVNDVHQFPGHIACDAASNSEIVVPMIKDDIFYGVMDIDSPIFSRFYKNEQIIFEGIVKLILEKSDMDKIYKYYN